MHLVGSARVFIVFFKGISSSPITFNLLVNYIPFFIKNQHIIKTLLDLDVNDLKLETILCYNRFVTKKYKKRKPTDIIRFGKK